MTARASDIRCAIGKVVAGDDCLFVLSVERYGDCAAIRGVCSTHDGGEITFGLGVTDVDGRILTSRILRRLLPTCAPEETIQPS